jgi:mono/diheme cytochrome c family protein
MRLLWVVVVAVLLVGLGTAVLTFRPHLPSAERGRRLALRTGCFACHGPEGTRGAANPGRTDKTVPTFEGDVMMFAKSREQIREWIHDGSTEARRNSETWRKQRASGTLRMPAFGRRLSARQIDDLVAFVEAMAGSIEPEDSRVQHGLERSHALGCDGCHGPGGRFARPNPGSLKGYVPSWDGRDFPELVKDSTEFREWVERGVSRRFATNPLARWFLDRAVLHMPGFEKHLAPGDVEALWAYVLWLRETSPDGRGRH